MTRELQVELLLGRRVLDVDGRVAGRIEELIAVLDGPDTVVTEFHLGPAALVERLLGSTKSLPFFSGLPSFRSKKARWDQIDLSDPGRPRLTVRRDALESV
jgi:hypothetical protein